MKWYNGWYDDDYDKGVLVSEKDYIDIMEKHCNGMGEIHTDKNGFPFLAPHENTKEETILLAKEELCIGDYQVIKALEKLLLGDTDLHKTRQAIRDKINELEKSNNGG